MLIDTTSTRNAQHFAEALALFKTARRAVYSNPPAATEEEEQYLAELVDAEDAATDYLMSHAAPDLAAVLAKIEIVAANPNIANARDWLAGIAADVMVIGGLDRSPTFDPFVWLCQFETRGGKTALVDLEGVRHASLSIPLGETPPLRNAREALGALAPHERAALDEYLLGALSPADYGLKTMEQGALVASDGAT